MFRLVGFVICGPLWMSYFVYRWYLEGPLETLNRRPYLSGGKHRDWPATIVAWLLMLVAVGLVLGIILLPRIAAFNYRW